MKKKGGKILISLVLLLALLLPMSLSVYAASVQDEVGSEAVKAAGGTIEAKVYLRYSNAVPTNTIQSYGAAEFGPSGNNTPYITVTVDLDAVAEKVKSYNNGSWIYYSIDSDSKYNTDNNNTNAGRKINAENFWKNVIYPAIEEGDKQGLDAIFGSNSFIGYVLKKETDGWHIDGILKEEPPVYVVELYQESNNQVLFAISESGSGVPYESFKKYVEQNLGADSGSYTWVTEDEDNLVVKYQKGGVWYQSTITPRNNVAGDNYTNYHVYPDRNSFTYRTVTQNIYFISRMKIKTEVLSGSLSISKTVAGSASNPEEHFTFTLHAPDADGNYNVTYAGTGDCKELSQHNGIITFQNQTAVLALRHGESASIQGLTGTVTVKENNGNYKTSYSINGGDRETYIDAKGLVVNVSGVDATVVFTNELDVQPETGIYTNAVPGLLAALAGIGAGVVVLMAFKKRERDNA